MGDNPSIVLAGFMGSGKSTVGKILAGMSGMPFIDVDKRIARAQGMSISEIFESRGEPRFRELEREAIREESSGGRVIAVGGGAVMDDANVSELKSRGIIYLLDVTAEDVQARLGTDPRRPLLSDDLEGIRKLLGSREERYRSAADVVVDTAGKDPAQVADNIYSDYIKRTGK